MNRIPVQALLALQSADRCQTAGRPTSRATRPQAAALSRLGLVLALLAGFSIAIVAPRKPVERDGQAAAVAASPIASVKIASRLASDASLD